MIQKKHIQKTFLRAAALGLLLCGSNAFPENGWAAGRVGGMVGSAGNAAASAYGSVKSGVGTATNKFQKSRVGQYAQKKLEQGKSKLQGAKRNIQKRRLDNYDKKIKDIDTKLGNKNLSDAERSKLNSEREKLIVQKGKMESKIAAGRSPSGPNKDNTPPPSYDQATSKN